MRPASLPYDASERGVNAADHHSGTKKAWPEKMRQAGDTATGRSWHETHPSATDRRAVLAGGRRVWRLGAARLPDRTGALGAFREQFFCAVHAHAGVLLVLSLVYIIYLERAGYSEGVQWLAGLLLLVDLLAQSGGSSCTWASASRAAARPGGC
jgi:hypothetical protein